MTLISPYLRNRFIKAIDHFSQWYTVIIPQLRGVVRPDAQRRGGPLHRFIKRLRKYGEIKVIDTLNFEKARKSEKHFF